MKNSNDTIENRTPDLPACRAVPRPTALPQAAGTAGKWGLHFYAKVHFTNAERTAHDSSVQNTTQNGARRL